MLKLYAESCAIDNNMMYFVEWRYNLIYSLDLIEKKTHIISSLPENSFYSERLAGSIHVWDNKLIVVPLEAEKVWIYNLEEKTWNGLELAGDITEKKYKFMGSILYEDSLIMFGFGYYGVAVLNLANNEFAVLNKLEEDLKNYKKNDGCFWGESYVVKDDKLYLATLFSNKILCLDLNSYAHQFFDVGDAGCKYAGIDWSDNHFWIIPRNSAQIVKWDGGKNVEIIPILTQENVWGGICTSTDKILLHSFGVENAIIDRNNFQVCDILNEKVYLMKRISGLGIVIIKNGVISVLDELDGNESEYECCIPISDVKEYLNHCEELTQMEAVICESELIDMDFYFNMIEKKNLKCEKNSTIGKCIYDSLCEGNC